MGIIFPPARAQPFHAAGASIHPELYNASQSGLQGTSISLKSFPGTVPGIRRVVTSGYCVRISASLFTSVTSQWSTLATQFSNGVDTILDFVEHGPLPMHLTEAEIMGQVQRLVEEGQDYVQSNAPTLATQVLSNAGTVADVFAVLALALFSTIFFLASGGRMWRWFINELPTRMRPRVHMAAGAG